MCAPRPPNSGAYLLIAQVVVSSWFRHLGVACSMAQCIRTPGTEGQSYPAPPFSSIHMHLNKNEILSPITAPGHPLLSRTCPAPARPSLGLGMALVYWAVGSRNESKVHISMFLTRLPAYCFLCTLACPCMTHQGGLMAQRHIMFLYAHSRTHWLARSLSTEAFNSTWQVFMKGLHESLQ